MKKILIIEDDKHLNKGLSIALEKNYEVISTFTINDAQNYIDASDLILLDMNLPDGDGLEIIKYTRKISTIPIIVLSAINLEAYIISSIELGADDYLTKPFSLGILEAKIKRTFEKIASCDLNLFKKDGLDFNFNENTFYVDDKNIDLTRTEAKILYYLIKNKSQVITKELLFDFVWGIDDEFIDQNTLSVNISRIRNKLKPYDPIETVFGVGYKWQF
ncbi:response regulator transcription factor [Peptoniphilus sp. AGMB00490]|uniref:Response regulator transcription factor n=1 Tax=Peptoniphilus faecalis TaxID=2731255 RepID=A0A848RNN7_9FIRM|nr:response regulator transcription factor [Peptoniphilus faecalis]NMW85754.1 response regulator transcription factor [Peptoniphilus faecalis]